MVDPIQTGGAGPNDPVHLETPDEKNLERDLYRLCDSLMLLRTSSNREDLFEDAKKGFESVVKEVIGDYNKSTEKGHSKPDIGKQYKDFMQNELMKSGSGPGGTGLIYGIEGDYQFNELPVNKLQLKDIQPGNQGDEWLSDLTGRLLSFIGGKTSDMQLTCNNGTIK